MLSVAVSLGLLGAAVHVLDWQTLRNTVLKVPPEGLVLVVCVSFLQFAIMSIRWHQLIRTKVPLPIAEHMTHYFYGIFLNTFTPANLGGDVYRVVALDTCNRASVLTALIQERLLGFMAFSLWYLVCLASTWGLRPDMLRVMPNLFATAGGIIALGSIGLALVCLGLHRLAEGMSRRCPDWLTTILRHLGVALRFESPAHFAEILGLSCLAVCVWVLTVHMVTAYLGLHLSWVMLGMIVVLVEFVRLLPVSIQGIGIREGAYAYLFGVIGESSEAGFIVGAISYLALSLSVFIAGAVGFGCLMIARQHRY